MMKKSETNMKNPKKCNGDGKRRDEKRGLAI